MSNSQSSPDHAARARWMSLLARAPSGALREAAERYGALPQFQWLRRPQTGLAVVRARTGGTGSQFNLGDMSLCRCALRIDSGEMGVAYVAGRDAQHAQWAALFDALLQSSDAERVEKVTQSVLRPIEHALEQQRATVAAQAQSTKVDFMTMVRGENS